MQKPAPLKSIRERYPPPWALERTPSGFCVCAANGTRLASVFGEDKPLRREILRYLTMTEAQAMAAAIVSLPELMKRLENHLISETSTDS